MIIYVFLYIAYILLAIMLAYTLYKVIWYAVKLTALRRRMKRLEAGNITVKQMRPLRQAIWGRKGDIDYEITTPDATYAVGIITFISTHSRWNIEKTREHYYVEARRYNKIVYRVEKNTGTEPEHARDYRRETQMGRSELFLAKRDPADGREHILLIYPKPALLTMTTTRLEHITTGDRVEQYKIMHAEDFWAMLES